MVKSINILNFKKKHYRKQASSHPKVDLSNYNIIFWKIDDVCHHKKGSSNIYISCVSKQITPQHNSKSVDLVQHEQMEKLGC